MDKATFPVILTVWLSITLLFGIGYFVFTSDYSHLTYTVDNSRVLSIADTIYYSFITGTTTGFGDIVPTGIFKGVSIVQVIICWLLLAVVTSRLVSIKQDAILTELYDISFKERINRLRSSLLLFRQSLDRITTALEEKEFKSKELKSVNTYLSSFDYTLSEIKIAIDSNKNNRYTKDIDSVNSEILFNSTLNSFEKLDEMILLLDKEKIEWKKELSIGLMAKCIKSNDELFSTLEQLALKSETIRGLKIRKEEIKQKLKNQIYD